MEPITNACPSQDLRRPLSLKIVSCAHPFCRVVAALAVMYWGGAISGAAPAPLGSLTLFDPSSGREVTGLTYAPAPIDNPLKGITADDAISPSRYALFPCSTLTTELPIRGIVTGPNTYDWTSLESAIARATNSGFQLIPRFYLDWTGWPTGIPQYLLDGGLRTWTYTFQGSTGTFPNYEDVNLRSCLTNFIAAYGARYDGDPRIAFVQIGTVGVYGEWHYGPPEMATNWASLTAQAEVMRAYAAAFTKTKLEFRYPAGTNNDAGGVPTFRNDNLPFGYYDDSYTYTTWGVGSWDMQSEMVTAQATDHWKGYPYGGEIRAGQTCIFSNTPCGASDGVLAPPQTWSNCASLMHTTHIHQWGCFYPDYYNFGTNALWAAYQLGYELWVQKASIATNGGNLDASVTITNTGVAPFYYPWTVQLAAATNASIASTWSTPWDITTIVPSQGSQTYSITLTNPPARPFNLLMRVVNPCMTGKPLRFANINQNATITNWLTLCPVR